MASIKQEKTPTQTVKEVLKQSASYQKYRTEFKPAYKHFLSCVGLEEKDWTLSRPRANLFCNNLHQQLIAMIPLIGDTKFLTDINPSFCAAVEMERDFYGQMKTALKVLNDFYTNGFEEKAKELEALGAELENLKKAQSLNPEQRELKDTDMKRFQELLILIKNMCAAEIGKVQADHLEALRQATDVYQKKNEQWSRVLTFFSTLKPMVMIKTRRVDQEKEDEEERRVLSSMDKVEQLGDGEKDL